MVFVLEESVNEVVRDELNELLQVACSTVKPLVSDCHRVGGARTGSVCPVKATFHSKEAAALILKSGKNLRRTRLFRVYIF